METKEAKMMPSADSDVPEAGRESCYNLKDTKEKNYETELAKMKPCPLCGGNVAHGMTTSDEGGVHCDRWQIQCQSCKCELTTIEVWPFACIDRLIRLWNTRFPSHDELERKVESPLKGERILCAAIWYKGLTTAHNNCRNIDRGVVLCGYGHANVIGQLSATANLRTVARGPESVGEYEDGFLTSDNRFVSREEAFEIAKRQGQIFGRDGKGTPHSEGYLFSEDLYEPFTALQSTAVAEEEG